MKELSADVCIVGSGVTGLVAAQKLTDERAVSVIVVEAGGAPVESGLDERRRRYLEYNEHPYPGDFVPELVAQGPVNNTMTVGGSSVHFEGTMPRYSPEDFRLGSLTGTDDDWPIDYHDLEPFYAEAERRIGVSGEPTPSERTLRSRPFPMPPIDRTYNNKVLAAWLDELGIANVATAKAVNSVAYDGRPPCTRCNTCHICPTGARYSPEVTGKRLSEERRIQLLDRTYARRLELEAGSTQVARVVARDLRSGTDLSITARHFLLAGGYMWTPHLLRASRSHRFPDGLANRSGLVGHYVTGHTTLFHQMSIDRPMYLGMQVAMGRFGWEHMKVEGRDPCRFGSFFYERAFLVRPPELRLADDDGRLRLGDDVLRDWRAKRRGMGVVGMVIYSALPAVSESRVVFDPGRKTPWGDPLPMVNAVANEEGQRRHRTYPGRLQRFVDRLARGARMMGHIVADNGHPSGGCRMGTDAGASVCDADGRTHDHENLWILGAPAAVSGGVVNSTLTFVALALRSVAALGRDLPARA